MAAKLTDHAVWQRLQTLGHGLAGLVLPPVCASCGRLGELFCPGCRGGVNWIVEPLCRRCGRPRERPVDQCTNCRQRALPLKRIRAAVLYTGPVCEALHKYKYKSYFALAEPLADLMVAGWRRWQFPFDVVVPMPLHPKREHQRGFNQATLLVSSIARRHKWMSDQKALWRVRATRPQVGLSYEARRVNMEGAFLGDPDRLADREVLLVDDVYTSGATLAAAATAALAAGATSVSAYCLAAVPTGREFTDV